MDADEVLEWQVWLQEPRGERRADYRSAQITHAVYTILQSFSGSSKKISLEDNLLEFTEADSAHNIEEQSKKNAMAMMSALGVEFTDEMSKLAQDMKNTFSKEVNQTEG